MIFAGDIGGTKTLFGLFSQNGSNLSLLKEQRVSSEKWDTLELIIADFLEGVGVKPNEIEACCLSLAGPIQGNICTLTNLGKIIDCERLNASFHFLAPITFCNDLVATGYGIFGLESNDVLCLNPEIPPEQNKKGRGKDHGNNLAVIAPGTGLGESIIRDEHQVCPTEGAHCDFAPRSEQELRLWRFLHQKYGHVSYERVLSGPGLVNIYAFLLSELKTLTPAPLLPTPAQITQKALAGSCPICTQTLEVFVQILGAEAGNLALKSFALGGIYLGGGIPPKILPKLQKGSFMQAFQDKGRFHDFVARIPVYVILNEKTALYGAARIAASSLNK